MWGLDYVTLTQLGWFVLRCPMFVFHNMNSNNETIYYYSNNETTYYVLSLFELDRITWKLKLKVHTCRYINANINTCLHRTMHAINIRTYMGNALGRKISGQMSRGEMSGYPIKQHRAFSIVGPFARNSLPSELRSLSWDLSSSFYTP